MAIRNIFREGDPILRRKAREVVSFDERLVQLLEDMVETMIKSEGIGLAAPQVGISRRAVIVKIKDEPVIELINPEIVEKAGTQLGPEGCLSVDASKSGYVERPMYVKIKAYDRNGDLIVVEGEGLKARAFCHEIDHLNGVLFIDKVCPPPKNMD